MIGLAAKVGAKLADAATARADMERRARTLAKLSDRGTAERIGDRAMRAYLDGVTRKLEAKHGTPYPGGGGGRLARRTGEGMERLRDYSVRPGPQGIEGRLTLTQGLAQSEFGGIIRAGGTGYLTVPLPAALDAKGIPKRWSARGWRDAFLIKSGRGNLLIVRRAGRKLVPLYVLEKSVRIPARLGMRKELSKQRPALHRGVRDGIARLVREA